MTDSAREFRRILGTYPTGVCAVTAISRSGNPVGLIVGSFTSVSLDPPLVGFFPDKGSATWPRIKDAGRFCINVLGDAQGEICTKLSAKGEDKFSGIDYHLSELGSPVIEGVLAWIDCQLDAVHDAGDHFIVLGRVERMDLHADGNPMIFHRGSYGKVVPI